MMSQQSKRELHGEVQARYLKASKVEKQKILDEFTATTLCDYNGETTPANSLEYKAEEKMACLKIQMVR